MRSIRFVLRQPPGRSPASTTRSTTSRRSAPLRCCCPPGTTRSPRQRSPSPPVRRPSSPSGHRSCPAGTSTPTIKGFDASSRPALTSFLEHLAPDTRHKSSEAADIRRRTRRRQNRHNLPSSVRNLDDQTKRKVAERITRRNRRDHDRRAEHPDQAQQLTGTRCRSRRPYRRVGARLSRAQDVVGCAAVPGVQSGGQSAGLYFIHRRLRRELTILPQTGSNAHRRGAIA
jgi:hypothetical protein